MDAVSTLLAILVAGLAGGGLGLLGALALRRVTLRQHFPQASTSHESKTVAGLESVLQAGFRQVAEQLAELSRGLRGLQNELEEIRRTVQSKGSEHGAGAAQTEQSWLEPVSIPESLEVESIDSRQPQPEPETSGVTAQLLVEIWNRFSEEGFSEARLYTAQDWEQACGQAPRELEEDGCQILLFEGPEAVERLVVPPVAGWSWKFGYRRWFDCERPVQWIRKLQKPARVSAETDQDGLLVILEPGIVENR